MNSPVQADSGRSRVTSGTIVENPLAQLTKQELVEKFKACFREDKDNPELPSTNVFIDNACELCSEVSERSLSFQQNLFRALGDLVNSLTAGNERLARMLTKALEDTTRATYDHPEKYTDTKGMQQLAGVFLDKARKLIDNHSGDADLVMSTRMISAVRSYLERTPWDSNELPSGVVFTMELPVHSFFEKFRSSFADLINNRNFLGLAEEVFVFVGILMKDEYQSDLYKMSRELLISLKNSKNRAIILDSDALETCLQAYSDCEADGECDIELWTKIIKKPAYTTECDIAFLALAKYDLSLIEDHIPKMIQEVLDRNDFYVLDQFLEIPYALNFFQGFCSKLHADGKAELAHFISIVLQPDQKTISNADDLSETRVNELTELHELLIS